ncbi:ribosome biogenesis GTPase Der [bacterium AH-315-J21]|nr:ribosome biogenesis GTPase Der [bacterium AH-315-J21]
MRTFDENEESSSIETSEENEFAPIVEAGFVRAKRTSLPLVAIVGRPNVGKSSLFNRFLKRRFAVVADTPGVTRDRNYAVCEWVGREFYMIDTGGMIPNSENHFDRKVMEQAEMAVAEADVILFVVDAQVAVASVDRRIAQYLQKTKKPAILAANKADTELLALEVHELQRLGLGEAMAVSAAAGKNIGDLLDLVVEALPDSAPDEVLDDSLRVAVIGRPNVGKSSLVNCILDDERNIVSEVAGTTIDAIDSPCIYEGQRYTLVDTAGLRRKMKVTEDIEFYTNLRAERALDACDVALVVIDATEGVTSQDKRILQQANSCRRGIVLVVNKWDLVDKDSKTADRLTQDYIDELGDLKYIPMIFVSALEGIRARKTLSMAKAVHKRASRRCSVSELNDLLENSVQRRSPASDKGKEVKLTYVSQPEICPPTFVFFCNRPEKIQKSYIRFLANRIRERFDFEGVPLRIKFKKK